MRNVLLVIKQELLTTIGKPSFWLTTFLFPLLILAISAGSQLLAERAFTTEDPALAEPVPGEQIQMIGYVDDAGLISELPPDFPQNRLRSYPNRDAAHEALEAGEILRYYVIADDFVESGELIVVEPDFAPFQQLMFSGPVATLINYNLTEDPTLTQLLTAPLANVQRVALATETAVGEGEEILLFLVPFAVIFIFFFVLTMSSGFMLRSVSKEKENRVVEILLLSLPPRALMLGKIIALGMVALLQIGLWLGGSLFLLENRAALTGTVAAFTLPEGFLLWAALHFLLGYVMYAAMLGALGALAPNAREASQLTFLVLLPLLLPMWLQGVFISQPNGLVATILSLFPLTAPVAMMARLTSGGVPLWQPILGLVLMGLTAYGLVLVAARFFRADTLLSSTSLSWQRVRQELKRVWKPG